MQAKLLQTAEKLLFVKQLYSYSNRATNARVRIEYAKELGVSERSFSDKMISHRKFTGQEVDVIERLYERELGQASFDNQFDLFVKAMIDGDNSQSLRSEVDDANQYFKAQEEANKLQEQNEAMATAGILVSQ